MEKSQKIFAWYVFSLIALGMMCGCHRTYTIEHRADKRVKVLEEENRNLKRQLEIGKEGYRK